MSENCLLVGYIDVFKDKLSKLKDKIKSELEKDRKERNGEQLKRMLKEAKGLKKLVKKMEVQLEIDEEKCRRPLFVHMPKGFMMHSGGVSHYKIECDALTDEDIECLAWIIAQKTKRFAKNEKGSGIKDVHGVPRGGVRLQKALEKYKDDHGIQLIVDDVLTTGTSMEEARKKLGWTDAVGVVVFARGKCPDWIKPMFEMHWLNTEDF